MRTTINNKVYDTKNAQLIADTNDYGGENSGAWIEKLYLTNRGNWFLHSWDGSLKAHATHYCDSTAIGQRITPINKKEALAWCEKHQQQEAIDLQFFDMVEDA